MAEINLGRVRGIDGEDGIDGIDGVDGTDGITPVKGVDYKDGVDGGPGPEGPEGPQGPAFEYADFTEEQLEGLIGPEGPQGPAFEYVDFTPEQLEELTGPQGDPGADGPVYHAGENITIDEDNVISAEGGIAEIPQATADVIGGIRARSRDASIDTEEIKIDEATGKLFMRPSGDGGSGNEDVRVVAGRLQYFDGSVWFEITDDQGNIKPPEVFIEPSPAEWFEWEDVDGGVNCKGFANPEIAGSTTSIKLPDMVEGQTVRDVVSRAFDGQNLEMVDLSLISGGVGDYAFRSNNITTVNIAGVGRLGQHCFYENRVSEVTVDQNTGTIDPTISNPPFDGNRGVLRQINWGNMTVVPSGLFRGALVGDTVDFSNITRVGRHSFDKHRIVSLYAPKLTHIGSRGFSGYVINRTMREIDLPAIEVIGDHGLEYGALVKITLGDSLQSIGSGAFDNQSPNIDPLKREIYYNGELITGGTVGPTIAGYKFNNQWEYIPELDLQLAVLNMLGGADDE